MSTISTHPVRIALFGASPDTANMGVSALYRSFLHAMAVRLPALSAVVFDNGLGERTDTLEVEARNVPLVRFGARGGRRYHRPENLRTMYLLSRFRSGAALNRGLSLIDGSNAVMDASGGDSFSDIYGAERFRNTILPKFLAVRRSRPLLLLPQTYGPYKSARCRAQARVAVLGAGQAWSRDARSHEILMELLGSHYDPRTHRNGVDMAFGLVPEPPPEAAREQLADWLDDPARLVGINVSGLIWSRDSSSAADFGFRADYRLLLRRFVEWILANSDANVLLVPHVFGVDGRTVSDQRASMELADAVATDPAVRRRVRIAPPTPDERHVKWIISRCAWFCGTRMHATIAGLSSAVPTASITYSDKALGVFETCGQGNQLVDPRKASTEECLCLLQELFAKRHALRQELEATIPGLKQRLATQMDEIAAFAAAHSRP
jgi:polysaccharide pyruvyl transferase WcaK-like protein